jgi:Rps23 Pro-64 3,4-dihydroxylase Tpa1-like proline 4-hydroxylase
MRFIFDRNTLSAAPFLHLYVKEILKRDDADRILLWLKSSAPWKLVETDFYEQHEFSLLDSALPSELQYLTSDTSIKALGAELERTFEVSGQLQLVEVSAHKLTRGQTIRIHNDHLEQQESHRLLIQLNEGWQENQGGLLMLFRSETPESLHNILLPIHGSGFAFEISPRSFHAVSSINSGERYTLVYTFRQRSSRGATAGIRDDS